ncbi:hypothetical protein TTRE_0000941401 [Trichuris trichiura]|uniref:Uncharacterized protein n=1 Tax=Trichuris trichiura TaxID=36087 RepID=A0A077ZML8_TRITR|nr:hypothetical protein TTRE_0000941401 [Trichuris trichiura]
MKGVGRYRQQDGGHGSWNPPRSVNSPAESTSPENGWRSSAEPVPDRLGNVVVGLARALAADA